MRANTSTDKRRGTRYASLRCTSRTGTTGDGSRHASARVSDLDALVEKEVIGAFTFGRAALFPQQDEYDLSGLLQAQARFSEDRSEVMELRSDDLISKAEARERLTAIKQRSEEIDQQLEDARASSSSAHMLLDLRREVMTPGVVNWESVVEFRDALSERFASLHIEKKRKLVSQLLDIQVHPGRGAGKYSIIHKVVVSLNSDHDSAIGA